MHVTDALACDPLPVTNQPTPFLQSRSLHMFPTAPDGNVGVRSAPPPPPAYREPDSRADRPRP